MLATYLGNLPAAQVCTAKKGSFSSKPSQVPDMLPRGGPNMDLYPAICEFGRIRVDQLVANCRSACRVSLCIVALTYATVNSKILTFECRCLFLMYRPPWWSKHAETCYLPYCEYELEQSVNDCWCCILGNLRCDRLQKVIDNVLAAIIRNREMKMLPALCWK